MPQAIDCRYAGWWRHNRLEASNSTLHHAYQNKIVLQRELISFAALASVANPESGLWPVLLAYADLLVRKAAERGSQMNKDQLAHAA